MNAEQIKEEQASFWKSRAKSSNEIIIICIIGSIIAGVLKWSGQSITDCLLVLVITGLWVIFESFKKIDYRLDYYEKRYLQGLIQQIDFVDFEREADRRNRDYENERKSQV
jgi:hypothetical protein